MSSSKGPKRTAPLDVGSIGIVGQQLLNAILLNLANKDIRRFRRFK